MCATRANGEGKDNLQRSANISASTGALGSVTRRNWLRLALGGGAGLVLSDLVDLAEVKAAGQKLKLASVNEFTTSC